ncbi:MAG: M20/M25/M40 family metallo-hydrolase [Gemmatimonadales bacterium]
MNLARPLGVEALRARVSSSLTAERRLRAAAESTFAPLSDSIRRVVAAVSVSRIYGYAQDLFAFDSKFITQPGNRRAIEYLQRTLASFGYEPELQWFEPRPGIRSANVIATLRGTVSPDVVYVVSSHFDSVERGPGADDNTSGTTALLEAARVLVGNPQPATIQFAFFTGEEAGLLGSREFVRRAQADGVRIAGALNNDMIGWANDQRLDNTIRYSNDGIRDIQHGAAMLFTDLITYDSRYYQNTDAAAYYEAYGDIVGGIGSYPILGNPHYHQSHDVLETINQRLVAEVSKTTVATIMLLASTPARPADLTLAGTGSDGVTVAWAPAPERDIAAYRVAWGPPADPLRHRTTVQTPRAVLPQAAADAVVSVKAVNRRGLESWDWARIKR